jgi:RHS repeat-associated protein
MYRMYRSVGRDSHSQPEISIYRFVTRVTPQCGASRKRGRTNMAVTNYYTVNGEIIGERTAGSARIDYLTDALGSVTATVNGSAQVVNTYRYKPYGAQLAKTGSSTDPAFQWVGSQGYGPMGRANSEYYLRGRHNDSTTGRFTSKDPFGHRSSETNPYRYAANAPVQLTDPSGFSYDDNLCAKWYNSTKWHSCRSQWNQCVQLCNGIGNVDHCCTDSWTMPVTGRECKCISPVAPPLPPPTCKCGCKDMGGPNCSCKTVQPPSKTGGGGPVRFKPPPVPAPYNCVYNCTKPGLQIAYRAWCCYKGCALLSKLPGANCPNPGNPCTFDPVDTDHGCPAGYVYSV